MRCIGANNSSGSAFIRALIFCFCRLFSYKAYFIFKLINYDLLTKTNLTFLEMKFAIFTDEYSLSYFCFRQAATTTTKTFSHSCSKTLFLLLLFCRISFCPSICFLKLFFYSLNIAGRIGGRKLNYYVLFHSFRSFRFFPYCFSFFLSFVLLLGNVTVIYDDCCANVI